MSKEQISVAHIHDSLFGKGGSHRYAASIARELQAHRQLYKVLSMDDAPPTRENYTRIRLPQSRVISIPRPFESGKPIGNGNLLANPEYRTTLQNYMRKGFPEDVATMYAQYYIAGATALDIRQAGQKVFWRPHTVLRPSVLTGTGSWDQILQSSRVSRRDWSSARDAEELRILREADKTIVGTRAEMQLIPQLYPEIPDLADRLTYVHLGLSQDFHSIGEGSPHEREIKRKQAKRKLLEHFTSYPEREDLQREGQKLQDLPDQAQIFYWLGRVQAGKGFEHFASAGVEFLRECATQNTEAAIMFAGGPIKDNTLVQSYYEALATINDDATRAWVEKHTIFTDAVDGELVTAVGHVHCMFSDNESFSFTSIEALAAGNKVIASNYPPVAEVTNGHALLIDPSYTDEAVQAMWSCLGEQQYWDTYSENHTFASRYTWENTYASLLPILSGK